MQYWLLKSEPSCYSIDDLKREKSTGWTDIRNYQARNFLRAMKKGDRVLFYHSSCDLVGVVGEAMVKSEAYSDPTQFDPKNEGYDKAATLENPRWSTVDIRFVKKFTEPLTLSEIKLDPRFATMGVVKQGSRLSVQPVSEKHFSRVLELCSDANIET
jgi:predicted RNA-binding protein with PUA-like domain